MPEQNVVFVDDDPEFGELVSVIAAQVGVPCTVTRDAASFLAALSPETTLVLLDLLMPGLDGIEVLRLLSQRDHQPAVAFVSGTGKRVMESALALAESLGLTVAGFLEKPFQLQDLEQLLTCKPKPRTMDRMVASKGHPFSEEEFHEALERDEFFLEYQPQIALSSGQVVGLEALVRWSHPVQGALAPGEFIPFAERHGLIDSLGWWVIERGLSEFCWIRDDMVAEASISLNVAVSSLKDLTFPDRLVALAKTLGVAPRCIVLEITETGLIQELSSTLDVLTRLRMRDVQLAIDDFGSGYSMMQQLRHVPATEIKIDRSFVHRLDATESDNVMVQKIIEIGRELHMRVVGEGVETERHLEYLIQNGCDLAQGEFFSSPLPAKSLGLWLQEHKRKTRQLSP